MRRLFLCSVLPWLLAGVGAGSRFDSATVKPLGPPPTEVLTPAGLVQRHGYPAEEHTAETEDGYVLGLTRILARPGPPVLMVNGLGLGTELWVLHGPGHDLAFVLADLGYDVWLGGQRGLAGSQGHLRYNISQPEYWDFSHDESGRYDLPAMIDVILAASGHTRLFFVGTSLGGTLFSVMCAERPDYCAAVEGNVQLAPAVYIPTWEQLYPLSRFNVDIISSVMTVTERLSVRHVLARSAAFTDTMIDVCGRGVGEQACFVILNLITGFQQHNMAKGWLGYTLAMSASGTSTRQIMHLVQLTAKGGSRKYDWGPAKNLQKYGTITPPSYNLSKISSPTLLYYSKIDRLITLPAMEKAIQLMGNVKMAKPVADPTYGHAEFVFGKDLYKLIYPDIVDFFDSISGVKSTS